MITGCLRWGEGLGGWQWGVTANDYKVKTYSFYLGGK